MLNLTFDQSNLIAHLPNQVQMGYEQNNTWLIHDGNSFQTRRTEILALKILPGIVFELVCYPSRISAGMPQTQLQLGRMLILLFHFPLLSHECSDDSITNWRETGKSQQI